MSDNYQCAASQAERDYDFESTNEVISAEDRYYYYESEDRNTYIDEREDEDGRLGSQDNHDSMVGACNF